MTKIAFIIYRNWAYEILTAIKKKFKKKVKIILITPKKVEFRNSNRIIINPNNNSQIYSILKKNKIDIVFYYGWSWIVSEKIYKNFLSFCLHPSKLPKFKGGTPIQHQIIRNIKNSAISIFKISKKIDGGDIYKQSKLSLKGSLKYIFLRITKSGILTTYQLIKDFQNNNLKLIKQKKNNFKVLKRRKNRESKIDLDKLKSKNFIYLKNFIRMLDDPYPNAYIELNNKKIYIKKVKKNYQKKNIKFVENFINFKKNLNGYSIKMKNCNALIVNSNL